MVLICTDSVTSEFGCLVLCLTRTWVFSSMKCRAYFSVSCEFCSYGSGRDLPPGTQVLLLLSAVRCHRIMPPWLRLACLGSLYFTDVSNLSGIKRAIACFFCGLYLFSVIQETCLHSKIINYSVIITVRVLFCLKCFTFSYLSL